MMFAFWICLWNAGKAFNKFSRSLQCTKANIVEYNSAKTSSATVDSIVLRDLLCGGPEILSVSKSAFGALLFSASLCCGDNSADIRVLFMCKCSTVD